MSTIGELAWWAALLLSMWGVAAGLIAARGGAGAASFDTSAARALPATAALLALALAGVTALLLAADFSYAFAATATNANLPQAWRLSALLSRGAGSWLLFAFLIAVLGAFTAPRSGDAAGRSRFAAALSAFVFLPLAWTAATDPPYAHAAGVMADGAGLDPDWQLLWTPLAHFLLVLFAAVVAVAAARFVARLAWRRWAIAAWAAGGVALTAALRRALAGPAWNPLDWLALAVWVGLTIALHRRLTRGRLSAHLAHAAAAAALIAGAGWLSRSTFVLPLASSASAHRRDPLHGDWRLTSDGASYYQELNRHVTAVLVDVRRGDGPVRVARAEWRDYLDALGQPIGDGTPVRVVLSGASLYAVVWLSSPPARDDAVLNLQFVPLFAFWWVAVALALSAAVMAARQREDAA